MSILQIFKFLSKLGNGALRQVALSCKWRRALNWNCADLHHHLHETFREVVKTTLEGQEAEFGEELEVLLSHRRLADLVKAVEAERFPAAAVYGEADK